jgi:nucleotide-binding universal stress UspA family protein
MAGNSHSSHNMNNAARPKRRASEAYPTVADGIIDQCRKRNCTMVVLGRKRMSKAEEFVMGDVCVKLVRGLEKAAVLVVKTQ